MVGRCCLIPEKIEKADKMYIDSNNNLPDLTHLIRSVQRIEGNPDCFGKADGGECDRLECFWRETCLKYVKRSPVITGMDFA